MEVAKSLISFFFVVPPQEFKLPNLDDPRTIIVMSKKGHTSDLYPREYGKIKKDYERMKGNK